MSYYDSYKPENASSAVIKPDLSGLIPEGLSVFPTELYFGALVIGEDQLIRPFKVKNIGRKTIKIASLTIQQTQDQFEIQGGFPELVRPGEEFEVNVRYFSDFVGLNTAVVVIDTTEERDPYTVRLSGRVVGSTYIEAAFEGFKAIVQEEALVRANADGAEATHRLLLEATLTAEDLSIRAAVLQEQTARVTADTAEATIRASAVVSLNSALSSTNASVISEQNARISAVNAVASDLLALAAQVNTNAGSFTAAITTEQTARASADSALSSRITTIEADYTTAGQATSIANAKVAIETSARVSAIAAVASDVTTLTATVNGHTSSLSVQSGAIATLNGKNQAWWSVTAIAGGRAQLRVYADSTGAAGVDITGDVRIFGSVQIYGNVIVDGTINGGQKIIANTITTILIQSEAISKGYYTTMGSDVAGTPNTTINFGSTNVTKDESVSDMDISCNVVFNAVGGSGDLSGNFYIVRDSTIVYGQAIIINGAGSQILIPVCFNFTDSSAGAGSHTYNLRFQISSSAGDTVYARAGTYIRIVERKR